MNLYTCKSFQMWNTSISTLFGKTPKIKYICENCSSYNETRLNINAVRIGKPYAKCELCGAINCIPIFCEEGDNE